MNTEKSCKELYSKIAKKGIRPPWFNAMGLITHVDDKGGTPIIVIYVTHLMSAKRAVCPLLTNHKFSGVFVSFRVDVFKEKEAGL